VSAAPAEAVWRGNEGLRPLLVPIADLKPHPRNPRRHDLKAIAASLEAFGQQRPVLALPNETLVAGHGTVEAAGDLLGWTHIAVVRSDLPDGEVIRYVLADNRTSDLGTYEMNVLGDILRDLMEKGRLEGTGYDADDADDVLAELGRMTEAERQATRAAHSETDEEVAEREALRRAGAVMREVVLMLSDEQYEKFGMAVRILRKELGVEGVIETVYRTVTAAALDPEGFKALAGRAEEPS
jgi:ParB-like chromosome segregation protein Spo0J